MRVKELLRLLAMMIPTFLILGAMALTLAFPQGAPSAPSTADIRVEDVLPRQDVAIEETEIGPVQSVDARYPAGYE